MRTHRALGPSFRVTAAVLAAALTSGALAPSVALAQARKPRPSLESAPEDKRALARQHYADAENLFAAGDYAGAYAQYKAANDILPAPQTLWKMATCEDKLGRPAEAVAAYEAFLAASPPASMADRVKIAHERVAELKKSLPGRVDVTTDPTGASVLVDGKAQPGKTPLSLQLPAGSHQLVFSLPGYDDAQRQVDAPGGTSQSLRVTLAPARAPAPDAPDPPRPPPPRRGGASRRSRASPSRARRPRPRAPPCRPARPPRPTCCSGSRARAPSSAACSA